jgi:hypothetical protein
LKIQVLALDRQNNVYNISVLVNAQDLAIYIDLPFDVLFDSNWCHREHRRKSFS